MKNINELPICLRVGDVAQILGVSKKIAYAVVKANGLAVKVGQKRLVVPKDRLVRFLES